MVLWKKPKYSAAEQRREFSGISNKVTQTFTKKPGLFEEIGVRKAGTTRPKTTFEEIGVRKAGTPRNQKRKPEFIFD